MQQLSILHFTVACHPLIIISTVARAWVKEKTYVSVQLSPLQKVDKSVSVSNDFLTNLKAILERFFFNPNHIEAYIYYRQNTDLNNTLYWPR